MSMIGPEYFSEFAPQRQLYRFLNLANGAKLWEFNAGAPLSASPAIANGRIVIVSQDGRLYCFG